MADSDITEAELLRRVMTSAQADMHTAMPGRVVTYDVLEQVADVEPQLILGGRELPIIPRVRVVWPRGGNGYMVFPVVPGDYGLMIFCEADISSWVSSGSKTEPGDEARHGIHGAVFVPGLYPSGHALAATPGATVLAGSDVRIGAADAFEPILHGQKIYNAFNVWNAALATYVAAVEVACTPPGTLGANVAFIAASDALVSGILSALSLVAKVK